MVVAHEILVSAQGPLVYIVDDQMTRCLIALTCHEDAASMSHVRLTGRLGVIDRLDF